MNSPTYKSIIPKPTPIEEAALKLEGSLTAASRNLTREAAASAKILWCSRDSSTQDLLQASEIYSKLEANSGIRMMNTSVLVRLLQALPAADGVVNLQARIGAVLQAFQESTPVPDGASVVFKSGNSVIDYSPELIALITKLVSITNVEISQT